MILDEDGYIAHYGTPRRSGRYEWGSGGNETGISRNQSFLQEVEFLRSQGLKDTQIAEGMGIKTTEFRARNTIARNERKQAEIAFAQRLSDEGHSNVAIGQRMGKNESYVRTLLAPGAQEKADILLSTANALKKEVDAKKFVDVGAGVEYHMNISDTKLRAAVSILQEQGYEVHRITIQQLGTKNETNLKILCPPGTSWGDVMRNRDQITQVDAVSIDHGRTFTNFNLIAPKVMDSKRVDVKYAEDGGDLADGVVYVRPGVPDVFLGGSRYAQVRVLVDGTHYIKGMAMYKDDLPDGIDLQFNTVKSNTGNKLDALKPISDDPDNPFGAQISRQILDQSDPKNPKPSSVMNLVNEEGNWQDWSKNLSSQMLSKQSPSLARTQLAMTFESRQKELQEIQSLTNPAVRKKLLESYADGVDRAAVNLKAHHMHRQGVHVILPVQDMSPTEVYAPKYDNGERVVLIRYPHAGTFEIPELTVNNRNPAAKGLLKDATDAIGINPLVAKQLSGADFDGDTVLVIPNNGNRVKVAAAIDGLKDFDPQRAFPGYPGMPVIKNMQTEMGKISNLITDMTIRKAPTSEIVRAVKHSMVIIDSEKKGLNYKLSAEVHGITALKAKYQKGAGSGNGAATLISRASAEVRVPERTLRRASEGGPIDPATGKKVYVNVGRSYVNKNGKVVEPTMESKRLAETDDAHTLSSGTQIERIYADHSNRLKALANQARMEMVATPKVTYSKTAREVYQQEVDSLNTKLALALRNAPLERQAQVFGNSVVRLKKQARPDMEDAELKKVKAQALEGARIRVGAKKEQIKITKDEWAAIQAGAISATKLDNILTHADLDVVKELATPRTRTQMTASKAKRAADMIELGYTRAEVARALGVSTDILDQALNGGE